MPTVTAMFSPFEAHSQSWEPLTLQEILYRPIPDMGLSDRWLLRALAWLGRARVRVVSGLEFVDPANDPFILALNHTTRRESLLVPAALLLRPWYLEQPAVERAGAWLLAGRSVGIFPEARVNRDPLRLLRGRIGAAFLSLETGLPIIPAGIYPSDAEAERAPQRAMLEIRIGAPLNPPPLTRSRAPIADLRAWHATIMAEIARLSGKAWIQEGGQSLQYLYHRTPRNRRGRSPSGRRDSRINLPSRKHWVTDPAAQIPAGDLERSDIAWFIATQGDCAAGTLRVWYDPTYKQYEAYGLKLLDPALRIEEFMRRKRITEVARFAVKAEFRGRLMIAAALMRVATEETVARDYTHLVTDVFRDDPHSPYHFHTKVLGFLPVATHDVGELHCRSRRITLVLDIKLAYQRMGKSGNWLFRYLTSTWDDSLHRRLAWEAPCAPIRRH